jgi:CSLREA domain-containing protein
MKKLLIMTFVLVTCNQALAGNFIVNRFEDASDTSPGDGQCIGENMAGGAVCSLRAAIMEANANPDESFIIIQGDSLNLQLTLNGDDDITFLGDLDIRTEMTITTGISGGYVIDGNGIDRLFHVHDTVNLTLFNGTLQNGIANNDDNYQGGAIKVEAGGVLLTENVTFTNNLAKRGGAVFSDGIAWFFDSYFHHNAVSDDVDSNFLDSRGSAILNRGALLFARSTAAHNGTLSSNPSNANLTGNQFAMHFNQNGGAQAPPVSFILNSTIANNDRGGIYSDGGFTNIMQSTIANHEYYGLRFFPIEDDAYDEEVQLVINRSLIAENEFKDCNDTWVFSAPRVEIVNNYNASSDDTCGFTGMDDIENISNPFNGSLHNWGGYAPTLMLNWNSNAIDKAGNGCDAADFDEDQRESARPVDGNNNMVVSCDMGALEFNPDSDPIESDVIFKNGLEPLDL